MSSMLSAFAKIAIVVVILIFVILQKLSDRYESNGRVSSRQFLAQAFRANARKHLVEFSSQHSRV